MGLFASVGYVQRILRRIEVNDETLAVDVIEAVGPAGHFMPQKHKLEHVKRELYIPRLFDRTPEAAWEKAGKKQVYEVAREKAKRNFREHHPKPLPNETKQEVGELVRDAQRELTRAS